MPFQLSPGVNVSEIDLTTGVPAVATSIGAIAGPFAWGPVGTVELIDSEVSLVKTFWEPNNDNAITWFSAANFLSYGKSLKTVRIASASATNATGTGTGVLIKNDDHYENNFISGNNDVYGMFAATYPGDMGNSLTVAIADATTFTDWEYAKEFDGAPSHTQTLLDKDTNVDEITGGSNINDEIHVIVVDTKGLFSGVKGTILERFPFLSKSASGRSEDGSSTYYAEVINRQSKFVRWMDHPAIENNNWGTQFVDGTAYQTLVDPITVPLSGGQNGDAALTLADYRNGYSMFADPDEIDVNLIIGAGVPAWMEGDDNAADLAAGLMAHVCGIARDRKDAVAFISPKYSDVIHNEGDELDAVKKTIRGDEMGQHNQNSYAVADCNWKYQYDKYNDVYRWIPCNADVAGLCAYTDNLRDPWWSPAGFNRGNLKNCLKLAWNPSKAFRDELYKNSINPIVNFPGDGTVLYGDKTMLAKPSAFDRINVRRLFIVLEKAIAIAAKYSLFEFNDAFTRSQFVNMVEPFLRDVKGRRGIYDFLVVCDESNNTGEVIDRNEFVGDIYIKPAKSINFIQLNFVAVRTGVDFSEVVGKF